MRSQVALLISVLIYCLSGQQAVAGKRVALVIGNSAYQNVAQLPNPLKDAAAIAEMFKKAGFDVVESRQNLKNVETRRALNGFFDSVRDAEIAVVFYAGHGIEIEGTNYIVPIDAVLERDRDVYDEAVSLDRIVQSIEPARQLRLVILDACRDNPFAKSTRRTLASRGVSRGLARVDPDTPNTLVAFAAKAGSTADDGFGEHSPFTTSLLKHLTVPGLDLRRALGRVRDDVMSSTGNRQEPFVFGSLGGADVSLVPAPEVPVAAAPPAPNAVAEIRSDYQFAERVGTKEAWDYFLATHDGGFYANLARAQRNKIAAEIAKNSIVPEIPASSLEQKPPAVMAANDQRKLTIANLSDQAPLPPQGSQNDIKVGALSPDVPAPGREQTSKEALDWDKVKDSADQSALTGFIKRYPNSPLSINAQQRLDVLKRAVDEREANARAEREAAAKAAEETRIKAEQQKAELAAAKKRDEDERKAKAAEAEQNAKAAAAEKKAAEAKQRTEEAERTKVAAEQARVEAEQKKAELAAAKKREAEQRQATAAEAEQAAKAAAAEKKLTEERKKTEEAERKKATAELEALRVESEKQAKQAEAERKKAEQVAALEAACKQEQTKLDELTAKGSGGSNIDDVRSFSKAVTCDRLRPDAVALLSKLAEETKKLAATQPNSPELIRAAQTQLARIGCFSGKVDGTMNTVKSAVDRYAAIKGAASNPTAITEDFVSELTKQSDRLCPLECKPGQTAKGEICVADKKSAPPVTASRRKNDDEEDDTPARRRKPAVRQADREPSRQSRPAPAPAARQQAVSRPSSDGGGNNRTMLGVGF